MMNIPSVSNIIIAIARAYYLLSTTHYNTLQHTLHHITLQLTSLQHTPLQHMMNIPSVSDTIIAMVRLYALSLVECVALQYTATNTATNTATHHTATHDDGPICLKRYDRHSQIV